MLPLKKLSNNTLICLCIFILSISLLFNFALGYDLYKIKYSEDLDEIVQESIGICIDKSVEKISFEEIVKILESENLGRNQNEYYYINIWNFTCPPCIEEMPFLDSIANGRNRSFKFFFITDSSKEMAVKTLKEKRIHTRNFSYLYGKNEIVSFICDKLSNNVKVYPIHIVINRLGEVKFLLIGAFSSFNEANGLINALDELNVNL